MKRQSDIGWFELIMGLILIILGIVIMRQPVGVLTWIVILCGVIAVISGIGDSCPVCEDGTICSGTFQIGHFSGDRKSLEWQDLC